MQQSPKSPLEFQGRDIFSFQLPVQFHTSALSIPFLVPSLPTPFPGTAASLCMLHILVLGPLSSPSQSHKCQAGVYWLCSIYLEGKPRSCEGFWRLLCLFWVMSTVHCQHGLSQLGNNKCGGRKVSAGSTVVRRLYHQINNFATKKPQS